ncbi:MAG: hypothetical protein FWE09_00815 [Treponema sp.]|nr:hypothetical protein [Treponema sp.]
METATKMPPATPEEIWAILRDVSKSQREFSEQMSEQMKENERRLKAEIEQREAYVAERAAAERKRDEEWSRLNSKLGGIENTFGEIVEHLVAPGIADRFNDLGFNLALSSKNLELREGKRRIAEIDLFLESADSIVAVEVKAKPHLNDMDKHQARIETLRAYRSGLGDKRRILGAIAGAAFGAAERKAALDAGFYVIVQSGDTMAMDIPEGFKPREW